MCICKLELSVQSLSLELTTGNTKKKKIVIKIDDSSASFIPMEKHCNESLIKLYLLFDNIALLIK